MRENGAIFKVTKNRLTKHAISETKFKDILNILKGPTATAYSDDAVAPAKVAVNFEKKFENFAPFLILTLFQNSISCLFIVRRNQPASKSLFISLNQKLETF